jgi:hypothetical protein
MRDGRVIIALDFDGVLVDSAGETGESGFRVAQILWPQQPWLLAIQPYANSESYQRVIQRFRTIRPCLETGWEAALLIRLIADPEYGNPTDDQILDTFQSEQKEQLLERLCLTSDQCSVALEKARNDWISQNDGRDWIAAHDFYEGACGAVRNYLQENGNEDLYVITTKAKEFSLRLLEQQGLYNVDGSKILTNHIFGLGSGPKADVLCNILRHHHEDVVAVMVEDNLDTLFKILKKNELKGKVLPTLASWGYNTPVQQQAAMTVYFQVLDATECASIERVLDPKAVRIFLKEFNELTNSDTLSGV